MEILEEKKEFAFMGTRVRLNPADIQEAELQRKLAMSTAEIGLSVRTTNCLDEHGISTVEDLLNCRRADLLAIPNFGEKTLEEVYGALEKIGFLRKSKREQVQNSDSQNTPHSPQDPN